MQKIKVAIICGGDSGEYEVSMGSAAVIEQHTDRNRYEPFLIQIKGSSWFYESGNQKYFIDKNDFTLPLPEERVSFDTVFNIIHGTPGEDGKIQGYFDMMGIPYTGSGRLTSALTFNKSFCIRHIASTGLVSTADSIVIRQGADYNASTLLSSIGLPCFVKPNKGGSSVGMTFLKEPAGFDTAVARAFKEDDEVLVEQFIAGTEVTCGVFRKPEGMVVLPLTEIVSKTEFFDYEAKYIKGKADEITPARITLKDETAIKRLSAYFYNLLDCRGVVRFDYILSEGKIWFLEANTVPGMSEASIVPQQAEVFGISLQSLISIMLEESLLMDRR